jgi:putative nucleotidyltransferase with HDIG domain
MDPILLIVDDEPSGIEAIESVLMNQGYNLAFASHGPEALAKACELFPDLILLDVMMPGMDGFEVCRRLRADPRVAEVPVVMVTALDDRTSRLRGIEAGADDFITKPLDRNELRARVRTITRLNRFRRLQEERAKLERRVEHLTALRTIDLAITTSIDLHTTLDVLLHQVKAQLAVDAAAILLLNQDTLTRQYAAGFGFRTQGIEDIQIDRGEDPAGQRELDQLLVNSPGLRVNTGEFTRADIFKAEGFQVSIRVPLVAKGEFIGVLDIFHRTQLDPVSEWMDFLETLGQQAAIAVDNIRMFEGIQRSNQGLLRAYDATIEGWSRALDLRDKETEGHTLRVTEITLQIARAVGVSEKELVHVRRGALLHDIGKLGVPDSILLKPGPLTDDEWVIMRKHPTYAYDLLSPIDYLRPALDIPYCHHEKWDGSGYPRGLKGDEIPTAARIFSVVDVWDALRSDRPYRSGWPDDKIRAHIECEAGKQFDPAAVQSFYQVFYGHGE